MTKEQSVNYCFIHPVLWAIKYYCTVKKTTTKNQKKPHLSPVFNIKT